MKDLIIKSELEWKRVLDASPDWFKENVNLSEVVELADSPHLLMVYNVRSGGVSRLTMVVQSKNNLNRQYFKNFDEATKLINKVKGKLND